MTCWDNCGYEWRAVGESTSCTRIIGDGSVINTRLTTEITSIYYDPALTETPDHQFSAIVKIYEHYVGDAFETLVYESVDTFYYTMGKVYYKCIEWEIAFTGASDSPDEVYIATRHKELCPGCNHPYVCDCEDTVYINGIVYSWAPTVADNPEAEYMEVELLQIAMNYSSVYVNVKIYRNSLLKYNDNHVIGLNDYEDITDSVLTHEWRVNCTDIQPNNAKFQLCYSFVGTGEGSGSTGSGMLIAQYFDSTNFGWSGGCIIYAETDNPRRGGGNNTAPTEIELKLYAWDTDYTTTINSTPIVTDIMIVPSEQMNNDELWIPFIWNTDIQPGEYIWTLQCLRGPHDGSFGVIYIDYGDGQLWSAWVNGYPHRNFRSRILGIATDETWEKVISVGDTFGNNYSCASGYDKIKINSFNGFRNVTTDKKGNNSVSTRSCYLSTGGNNLSFEEPNLAGWTTSATTPCIVERSTTQFNDFPTCGSASAKMSIPFYEPGPVILSQNMIFTNCTGTRTLHFDYYVPSTSHHAGLHGLTFFVYINNIETCGVYINTQGLYNVSIPDIGTNCDLMFKIQAEDTIEPRTIYIDNIRFTGYEYTESPVGKMVGGSSIAISDI